jgi:hypothetical protein
MKKIILLVAVGILLVAAGVVSYFYFFDAKLARAKQNLVELPVVIDPSRLAPNQQAALLTQAAQLHPNPIFATASQGPLPQEPIIQVITVTQGGKVLPPGQAPAQGGVMVAPTTPSSLPTPAPIADLPAALDTGGGDSQPPPTAPAPAASPSPSAPGSPPSDDDAGSQSDGPPSPPAATDKTACSDTDGGYNYTQRGSLNLHLTTPTYLGHPITDVCYADVYPYGQDVWRKSLLELSCEPHAQSAGVLGTEVAPSTEGPPIYGVWYDCPSGCQDGACVDPSLWSCSDTDGGQNYGVKGTASWGFFGSTDSCQDDANGQPAYLNEAYCDLTAAMPVKTSLRLCPDGCVDGACVGGDVSDLVDEMSQVLYAPQIEYSGSSQNKSRYPDSKLKLDLAYLKRLVEKYYGQVQDLYGPPVQASQRTIRFEYLPETSQLNYLPQYDAVVISHLSPQQVVQGLITAFEGEYASALPETWRYGLTYAGLDVILHQAQPQYSDISQISLPEEYPIYGGRVMYEDDVLQPSDRVKLAARSFLDAQLTDQSFMNNLSRNIQRIPPTAKIWRQPQKAFDYLSKYLEPIGNQTADDWYQAQAYLNQSGFNLSRFKVTDQPVSQSPTTPLSQPAAELESPPAESKSPATPTQEQAPIGCIDTDDGIDLGTAGAIKNGDVTVPDFCPPEDPGYIHEGVCGEVPGYTDRGPESVYPLNSGGYMIRIACPGGTTCQAQQANGDYGACVGASGADYGSGTAPANWPSYSSGEYHYRLHYLSDWQVSTINNRTDSGNLTATSIQKSLDNGWCSFEVLTRSMPHDIDLIRNYSNLQDETTTQVAGVQAIKLTYTNPNQKTVGYYFDRNGIYYNLVLNRMGISASDQYCLDIFDQILSSWQFTE